jgi:hypothetical protein
MMPPFDDMNDSELVLLAQDHDIEAHRGLDRSLLIEIISSSDWDNRLPKRQLSKVRLRVMEFVQEHWLQVRPLVQSCPARTQDSRACFQCSDVQSVQCALMNRNHIFKKE